MTPVMTISLAVGLGARSVSIFLCSIRRWIRASHQVGQFNYTDLGDEHVDERYGSMFAERGLP